MRLLLVCLVLLGTSWVGTEALSLTDLLGISYNTSSAPVTDDQPPSHAHHHHHHHHGHGHSTDDEDASDAHASHAHHLHGHSHTTDDEDGSDTHASHAHHHHGHAHTNIDGSDTPQEYPRHHLHEHHDDEGDDDNTPLDHRHPHPHHHHGHNHDLDGSEEDGHDSERLRHQSHHHPHHHHHNHTHHNHTHHPNHSHSHHNNHNHPPRPHHPHHHDHSPHSFQDYSPYRAPDRRIFTFGDPMSLDERRQHNRWASSTRSPNTGSHHGHVHIRPTSLSGPLHAPPPAHGPRTLYTYPFARPIPPFDHPFHRDPHGHTPHHHTGPHTHHIHIPQPTNAHIYPHHYSPVPPLSTTPRRLRCPMLYSLIGDRCIAIFSIARMPWNDAKQFCDGIFGELFTFSDLKEYHDMVVYLRRKGLTSPMWIGGRELLDGNWWWVNGESIPKGTPYWAVRATSGRGAPTMQLPEAGRDGVGRRCAAMNPEDFYYLSDAECDDHKVPVCVLTGNTVVVALGDTMAPSSLYPALEPRTCRNWMLSKESSEASREKDNDDKSEEGSAEGEKTTQESHKKNSEEGKGSDGNQVDASEGVFEKEGEGSGGKKDEGTEDGTGKEEDENKQEGVSQITTTPTPDGAEDETAVEDDTDTGSGSGVGETIFGDDEDLVEGSGDGYYFMWRMGDY